MEDPILALFAFQSSPLILTNLQDSPLRLLPSQGYLGFDFSQGVGPTVEPILSVLWLEQIVQIHDLSSETYRNLNNKQHLIRPKNRYQIPFQFHDHKAYKKVWPRCPIQSRRG